MPRSLTRPVGSMCVVVCAVALTLFATSSSPTAGVSSQATGSTTAEGILPLEEFSPAFLGIYRKMILIEGEIQKYAQKYDVDIDLARAVCLYESGANPSLNSWAGAQGYFQVMPATFRSLGVATNIEAGIKVPVADDSALRPRGLCPRRLQRWAGSRVARASAAGITAVRLGRWSAPQRSKTVRAIDPSPRRADRTRGDPGERRLVDHRSARGRLDLTASHAQPVSRHAGPSSRAGHGIPCGPDR